MGFEYASESDGRRYPMPRRAPIEGGRGADGDRHVIVVDRSRCRLYELFAAYPQDGGARWSAGSGAIWNLRSNRLRPRGWTSADAAGLPILPGLARYDEVQARAHRPRAALHGVAHAARVRLPGPPLRLRAHRPEPAGDGPAPAAAARLRHLRLPAPVADRAAGAQALRDDPGRQRLVLVRQRRAEPGLGQRRPARAPPASRAAPSRWSTRAVCRAPAG